MFIEKVNDTIRKYSLLRKGEKILIAVSGGPDSTALLFALNALKQKYAIRLHIAHLDHMLRGEEEARKDRNYVLNLARKLKLPFSFGRVYVTKYAKERKLSLEEAAREMRYEFLSNVAKDIGAKKIALGHTLDDQAETVLMRLIRGAGLGGLRGIPPTRRLDGVFVIRPLIEIWRKDIDVYLRSIRIKPRQDLTNLMPKFLRNRVRHKLMPCLEQFNANIKETLARNAENIACDYEVLMGIVDETFKRCAKVTADAVYVRLRNLKTKPVGLRRQILRKAIEILKGDLQRIEHSHIEGIEDLIRSQKGSLDLPNKVRVTKEKGLIVFCKLKDSKIYKPKIWREVSLPGRTFIPELNLLFDAKFIKGKAKFKRIKRVEYLDYDKVKLPLYVRTWENGDRFKPLGMAIEKKLQDFYVDEKVPRSQRGSIPLLISNRKIIWVCGLRLSDDVKISAKTKRILRVSYKIYPC